MQNRNDGGRNASGTERRTPGGDPDDGLAAIIEQMHGAKLAREQAVELRLSLESQTAAIEVLRRFELKNDDAPCFIFSVLQGNANG